MLLTSVLLSAFFAGVVATLVTVAIEKFGGRTGGVLATVPTTIVPAAIGMYSMSSGSEFDRAMSVVPLGMLVNALFLLVWMKVPTRFGTGLVTTMILSLLVWAMVGTVGLFGADLVQDNGLSELSFGLLLLLILVLLGIWSTWTTVHAPKGKHRVRPLVLIARGSAAALAIGCAVWLSSLSYAMISGLVSTFPAIFLTSMVALWLSQGQDVPQGAAGPMMLGGASVAVYAIVAMWLFPLYGVVIGSILTWVISVGGWTVPAYFFLQWRQSLTNLDQRSDAGTSTISR